MGIIGLIEGIIYLTKSDEDFVNTYITTKKAGFKTRHLISTAARLRTRGGFFILNF